MGYGKGGERRYCKQHTVYFKSGRRLDKSGICYWILRLCVLIEASNGVEADLIREQSTVSSLNLHCSGDRQAGVSCSIGLGDLR